MTVVRYQATEPANERSPATPRTWRALGEKGIVTSRPPKWPARQPSAIAAAGVVAAHDPRAVEHAARRPARWPPAAPARAAAARRWRPPPERGPPPRPPGRRPAPPIAQRPSAVGGPDAARRLGARLGDARGRSAHNTANAGSRAQVAPAQRGAARSQRTIADAPRRRPRADGVSMPGGRTIEHRYLAHRLGLLSHAAADGPSFSSMTVCRSLLARAAALGVAAALLPARWRRLPRQPYPHRPAGRSWS